MRRKEQRILNKQKLSQQYLYRRYSQSQSYYYIKSLSDFIKNARTTQVIRFYFNLSYHDKQETQLKKYYSIYESIDKMNLLVEYYKYHNEIPRFFMLYVSDLMSNYHDKKRRIEYFKIKRMIEEENKRNPNKPKKGIVGDVIEENESQLQRSKRMKYSNVLADIDDVSATIDQINKKLNGLRFNVGELQSMPAYKEQEQVNDFLNFIQDQKRMKTQQQSQVHPPYSARNNIQFKPVSKQMLSRKLMTKQQTIASISPRSTIKDMLGQGSQTSRINNLQLNKMLSSPTQSLHKSKLSYHQNSCSISKQLKLSEVIKLPIKLHQHTRSEFKFIRK